MADRNSLSDSPLFDSGPRKPFPGHNVAKARYITSNDMRGYIPVYEYPLRGQWIMMDMDDGYVLWTGIWKALGHSKADIVKFLDSEPEIAPLIRRIRGGYLKIQGTWMPYEVALRLSRRVAWDIRFDLIPFFGPSFPSTCLSPGQPGFGQIISPPGRSRRVLCGPFVSHSSPSTVNHKFSVELSQLSSKKQARSSSSKGADTPRLSMRPPNSSRHFHRYAPYSDVRLKAHKSPVVSSPERVIIHDISESSPSQNPAWVRAMRASWPAVRPSNVTLPSIVAFDNVPDVQSRDPPSVVLQRLKEDSSLPRYSSFETYSKAEFCPLPLLPTPQRIAEIAHVSHSYQLRACPQIPLSHPRASLSTSPPPSPLSYQSLSPRTTPTNRDSEHEDLPYCQGREPSSSDTNKHARGHLHRLSLDRNSIPHEVHAISTPPLLASSMTLRTGGRQQYRELSDRW